MDLLKNLSGLNMEWRPPRCTLCKIFGHIYEHCTIKETIPPVDTTPNVVPPTTMHANDGFHKVSRQKKKGKSQPGIVGNSIKQSIRYVPKKTTSEPKKVSKLKPKGPSSKGGGGVKCLHPILLMF